jgi:hypothetical protein
LKNVLHIALTALRSIFMGSNKKSQCLAHCRNIGEISAVNVGSSHLSLGLFHDAFSNKSIVTCMVVTTDGVWIRNRIYWTLTIRNYNYV